MLRKDLLKFFAVLIETELGIVYAEENYFQLETRLESIVSYLGLKNVEELQSVASRGLAPAARQLLLDLATNNETSFFRDAKVFRALESWYLPQFTEKKGANAELKIWSAACSSGQEPLSLAIVIKEWNERTGNRIRPRILATDVSKRMIERASSGTYSSLEVQRGMPSPLLLKYFQMTEEQRWKVSDEIRAVLSYRGENLRKSVPPEAPFDLIFCRNALIYQGREGKLDIVDRLLGSLVPGGILVLGAGESLIGLKPQAEFLNVEGAVFYKNAGDGVSKRVKAG